MLRLEDAVFVGLPPRRAFEVAAAPENMPRWNPAVTESEVVGELGPGARVIQTIELMGRTFESEFEVTTYEPGRALTFSSVDGPMRIEGTMRFERAKGGTLVRWTVAGDCRGFLKVAEGLLVRVGRRELRACLESLKALLEEQASAA